MKITFNANSRSDNEISRISVIRGESYQNRIANSRAPRFRSKIIFPIVLHDAPREKLNVCSKRVTSNTRLYDTSRGSRENFRDDEVWPRGRLKYTSKGPWNSWQTVSRNMEERERERGEKFLSLSFFLRGDHV